MSEINERFNIFKDGFNYCVICNLRKFRRVNWSFDYIRIFNNLRINIENYQEFNRYKLEQMDLFATIIIRKRICVVDIMNIRDIYSLNLNDNDNRIFVLSYILKPVILRQQKRIKHMKGRRDPSCYNAVSDAVA
jgi:hypothetical protein